MNCNYSLGEFWYTSWFQFFSVSLFLNINKTNESDSKKTSELKSRLFEICFVGLINYVALLEVD